MNDEARRERLVALVFLTLFGAVLAVLLARHEMWRDELQAWLLARDSGSPLDLWRNTRYEGHPLLWHLLLYPLSHVFSSPVAMQALHWLLATGAAALVLLRAPFALWARAGIVFSYLPLYEYGAISRNYLLGVLGLWLVCVGLEAGRGPWLAVAGALVVANSNPIGIVVYPAVAAAILLTPGWRRQRMAVAAALAAGVAVAILQCLPPADYDYARRWNLAFNPRLLAYVCRGFIQTLAPIPQSTLHFWCTSSFLPAWPFSLTAGRVLSLTLAPATLALVAGVGWAVRSSRRALTLWVLGFACLLAFFYVKLPGQIRQFGLFWAVLVGALWIASADGAIARRWTAVVLAPTLLASLWASAVAVRWDWGSPFSGARDTARAITAQGLARLPIVGGIDYPTSGVAGYLPGTRLYYPSTRAMGSFILWNFDRAHQDELTQRDIVVEALGRDRGDGVVLLLNAPLSAGVPVPCREVHHSEPTIIVDEQLWAYLCRAPARLPAGVLR
jgi:hypothetical protein